ncbi:MAG: permease prefix domain 1-containing protein, partial [Oscillospiraceae bacterium]|nr:permease prefix domain 1-containing protein [Oscillospiraceae bacterium]
MEDIKRRITETVANRLAAAPQSAEKDELVEELADNLYHRFLDMTGAGVDEQGAFDRAMDDLGDVDELLAYLGVNPSKADATITTEGGQTRIERPDGRTVVINHGEGQPITINNGNGRPITITAGNAEADEERARADEERARADEEQARTEEYGGSHSGFSGQPHQSDLDAILAGVQEACNVAIDQAKIAIQQAKDAIQRRTTVDKGDGHVHVRFYTNPEDTAAPEPPVPPEP